MKVLVVQMIQMIKFCEINIYEYRAVVFTRFNTIDFYSRSIIFIFINYIFKFVYNSYHWFPPTKCDIQNKPIQFGIVPIKLILDF